MRLLVWFWRNGGQSEVSGVSLSVFLTRVYLLTFNKQEYLHVYLKYNYCASFLFYMHKWSYRMILTMNAFQTNDTIVK